MDRIDEIIVEKQKFATKYCKDMKQLEVLQNQIRYCQELGRALTKDMIIELAAMPPRRMENAIRLHKFV